MITGKIRPSGIAKLDRGSSVPELLKYNINLVEKL